MSDFRIIDALCALVETQNAIIKAQNLRLGELGEILMDGWNALSGGPASYPPGTPAP